MILRSTFRLCSRCYTTPIQPFPLHIRYKSQSAFLKAFLTPQISKPSSTSSILQALSTSTPKSTISASSPSITSIPDISIPKSKPSSWPETNSRSVGTYLLLSSLSVFGLVIFGGLTRLTESGLSITEWRPVTGSLPPLSEQDWEEEFALYRNSPEFKQLNSRMTREEFEKIYWMEWIHRAWGRFVGMSFVVPAVYFVIRRRMTRRMAVKVLGITGLIGFQGMIGWWMVKSGLKDDLFAPGAHPRVSQYRLTTHLGTAFLCYLAMFWNGISVFKEHSIIKNAQGEEKLLAMLQNPKLRLFKTSVMALTLLVFVTAMSGGLVAGLDAGSIYNEFPYMGLGLTPPKAELFDPFYSHVSDRSDLWWRNMLENPSLVQLDHRILATTTFTAIMAFWSYTKFNKNVQAALPLRVKNALSLVVGLVWMQATLGITTLIYLVPLPLASAHQAGALALLTGTVFLGSRIWTPSHLRVLLRNRLMSRRPTSLSHKKQLN